MVRFIFIILSTGFLLQTSNASDYLKLSTRVEQCTDINNSGEEKAGGEIKDDHYDEHFNSEISLRNSTLKYTELDKDQFYPTGYSTKHFLPPKYFFSVFINKPEYQVLLILKF